MSYHLDGNIVENIVENDKESYSVTDRMKY